ncbi:sigma-70 family RNA polymerase sigma factor [Kitasatospora sp. NPDC018058]|uniref:sigma-70 family RNA polymerase sigma factor n=1 Tax=Kitasatospora sp. NPDC018058 TaxID=3364025 RepID=UPI0037C1A7C2
MHREGGIDTEAVAAARAGDEQARERLVAGYLPLVYNVVGRAMNGHPDVDDVVQETMIRVVGGLGGLRDPSSFRSWLVAVAMNEVRRYWSTRTAPASALDAMDQLADPAGDFVGLTVLRLGLSGQRREVAEATRWLDEGDRDLLSLWWLEAAGRLTRAELTAALELSSRHAAVRVQRMKEQLEVGRTVVRALAASPCCPELAELTTAWDGRPSALWRKRIARHIRACDGCADLGQDLVPAEGLLAGLALVVPLHDVAVHGLLTGGLPVHTGQAVPGATGTVPAAAQPAAPDTQSHANVAHSSHRTGTHPRGTRRGARHRLRHGAQLAGALTITVAALVTVRALPDQDDSPRAAPASLPTPEITTAPAAAPTTASAAVPTTSASSASPAVSADPTPTPSATPPPRSPEQQLVDLINAERAKSGCRPLHVDPRLHTAAQQHSQDMAAHHYFDHLDPEGSRGNSRITAAGYQWSTWGENLDRKSKTPADVLTDWLDGAIHQQNILDCKFTDAGVGTAPTPAGPLWTLDLAAPN